MHLPSAQHVQAMPQAAAALSSAVHPVRQPGQVLEAVKPRSQQSAAAGTDSEDDSWTPGQQQAQASSVEEQADAERDDAPSVDGSSDDDMMAAAAYDDFDGDADEAAWDPDMPLPVYCTNCTARIHVSDRCSDCGHSNELDSELLSCTAVSADTAAAPAGECPLIIWDESMLLHEEGKHEPHPERPDRLRAVMAQLSGNGLTGK